MKQCTRLLPTLSLVLLLGCGTEENQNSANSDFVESNVAETSSSELQINNFAVVWTWTTDDVNLVSENSPQISKELTDLWKNEVVENAYYDTDSKIDKLEYFPNITFFLKAKNATEAQSVLNQLTVVSKGIAKYQLYPVGPLWLERKTDVIRERGITKSFVAVWTTQKSPFVNDSMQDLLQNQNDSILELWKDGQIENVYFDIEGTREANSTSDFVFFVNADSESEARILCESLPFFTSEIATYELFQVGVFWMGKYKDQ